MANRAPSDLKTVAEIRDAVEDGRIPHGSTVEMSLAHPELKLDQQISDLVDFLKKHGVSLVREARWAPDYVVIRPPERGAG